MQPHSLLNINIPRKTVFDRLSHVKRMAANMFGILTNCFCCKQKMQQQPPLLTKILICCVMLQDIMRVNIRMNDPGNQPTEDNQSLGVRLESPSRPRNRWTNREGKKQTILCACVVVFQIYII